MGSPLACFCLLLLAEITDGREAMRLPRNSDGLAGETLHTALKR